jgi:hypothetical protein
MTEIDELALRINDLLTGYVAIHDNIFKFSIRRILPLPFVFQAINYGRYFVQLSLIKGSLISCREQALRMQLSYSEENDQTNFLRAAETYLNALIEAATRLSAICAGLAGKAEQTSEYKMARYNNDLDLYRQKVETYRDLGNVMNHLYHSTYNRS